MIIPTDGYNWKFDTDRLNDGILVDRINVDMPEYKPGKTYRLELLFTENTRDDSLNDTGGTLGGSNGFTLGGTNGATLGSPPGPEGHVHRYDQVREYTRYAGRYQLKETIDGTPKFSEFLPADATVPSIIIRMEPGNELEHTPGLWVIIDDVEDTTQFIDDQAVISLRVVFVAKASEYADRTAIKNELGSDLV